MKAGTTHVELAKPKHNGTLQCWLMVRHHAAGIPLTPMTVNYVQPLDHIIRTSTTHQAANKIQRENQQGPKQLPSVEFWELHIKRSLQYPCCGFKTGRKLDFPAVSYGHFNMRSLRTFRGDAGNSPDLRWKKQSAGDTKLGQRRFPWPFVRLCHSEKNQFAS